ncbi:MAG: hypothetical protein FWB85_10415 [Chitinispirillia bacterium]|nr:hypothetical protein [Chitinispirillia bacterium]MCL2242604.1 hypothetical protein [Chitinispirillia bacterium]
MKPYAVFILLILLYTCTALARQPAIGYEAQIAKISEQRQLFSERYNAAPAKDRAAILAEAQEYLTRSICDTIFPYWYGTPWQFYGTTRTPKQGAIACGYFVTTTLTDAGFQIPLVKWAQAASENVVVKIGTGIKRFSNRPMSEVIAYINQNGDGLYLTGLDCHIGYIYKSGGTLRFVHSSYYREVSGSGNAIGVISEPLEGRNPLNDSQYRVIGKLLGTEMVRNWVTGARY